MFVFAEPVGVALAARLRPGSATANDADDQLQALDDAIAALPPDWQAGHHGGDDPDDVAHPILVRTDIAGYSREVIGGLAARNLAFSIGMPANERFDAEIHRLRPKTGSPLLTVTAAPAPVRRSPSSRPRRRGCPTAPG